MRFPIEYCVAVTVNIYHNTGRLYSLNSIGTGFRIIYCYCINIFYFSKYAFVQNLSFQMFKRISTNGSRV